MGTLAVQSLTTARLAATYTACSSGGDEFINDGHTIIHIKNPAASTESITIMSQFSPVPKGLAVANISVSVDATEDVFCGFFNQAAYNDSSGMVQMTYNGASNTSPTIAAISVT